jgi:hypothetical protein
MSLESELTGYIRTIAQSAIQTGSPQAPSYSCPTTFLLVGPPHPPGYTTYLLVGPPHPPGHLAMETLPEGIVPALTSLVTLKQVATRLRDSQTRADLLSAVDQAITEVEDSYCGTPPRPLPAMALAFALTAFASRLEEGDLRTAILQQGERIAQKGFRGAPLREKASEQAA